MRTISRRGLILAAPALLLPGVALAALAPTPYAGDGPFYPSRLPADQDNDLIRVEGQVREAGGEVLNLSGTVFDANARPVAGARVEIWQCDAGGVYDHPRDGRHDRRDQAFQGFGHAVADAAGRFRFRTIVPTPYPGRTPHIHMKVVRNGRAVLTTRFYRQGFAQNAGDFLFNRMSAAEQERVGMILRPVAAAARPTFETEIKVVVKG
jgi:protocatechuate 3,4-dioxygenase beta subunit